MTTRAPTYETKHILGTVVVDPTTKKKRVKITHPSYYEQEIEKLPVNSDVMMVLTTKKPTRSLMQNAYMHLYFTLIAMAHGHGVTMEEVKTWAKGKCLASGITEIFGDKVRKVKETHRLTVGEMIEFLARVECESGVPLPDAALFKLGVTHEEFKKLRDEGHARYKAMSIKIKNK